MCVGHPAFLVQFMMVWSQCFNGADEMCIWGTSGKASSWSTE